MKHISKRETIILIMLGMLFLLLVSTDPEHLPLPLLISPFILLFSVFYLSIKILLDRFWPNLGIRPRQGLSLSLAALPVLMLVLQSISQLTIRDLLITAGLISLLMFYFRKIDFLV